MGNIKVRKIPYVSIMILILLLTAQVGWGGETPKPDLVLKALFFDANNVLNLTFKNEGNAAVPAGKGSLEIFIDGRPLGGYSFPILADQSFRNPGGSLTIRTNFRMSGSNRRIAVFVDSQNEISESNEFQNALSRTLTPPVKSGPDFIVSDLSLGTGNALRIQVKNIGTASSPANLHVRIRVIVNETVRADLTPALPSLTVNSTTLLTPTPAIVIGVGNKVRVLLNTNNLYDDLDSTNNIREELLPDGPSLTAYNNLLAQAKIKNNIIWQESSGVKNYSAWTAGQKTALNNAILALERGENPAGTAPPALLANNYISANDAWKVYLAHIAQSLWVEVHGAVSWHLSGFTDSQLAYLLDSRKLMSYNAATNRYKFINDVMGNITAWNPRASYEFMTNLKTIKSNQAATIYALTDWMRGHLNHISSDTNYSVQYGYAGPPPADKVLYPLEGKKHITAGCWGTSGLYAAVLRGVNIPVEHARTVFYGGASHSRPSFPSVDRSMPHGDDPYSGILVPSGAIVASSKLFYTLAQMNGKFINPPLDCVSGDCNTVGEQASYNTSKDHWQLAYDYMTDYIMYQYAQNGAAYLNDSLRGDRVGGSVQQYAKPFFTDAERAAMVTAVENKIKEIGDGNLATGKTIVIQRFNRFLGNK